MTGRWMAVGSLVVLVLAVADATGIPWHRALSLMALGCLAALAGTAALMAAYSMRDDE